MALDSFDMEGTKEDPTQDTLDKLSNDGVNSDNFIVFRLNSQDNDPSNDGTYLVDKAKLQDIMDKFPGGFSPEAEEMVKRVMEGQGDPNQDPLVTLDLANGNINVIMARMSDLGNEGMLSQIMEMASVSSGKLPVTMAALGAAVDQKFSARTAQTLSANLSAGAREVQELKQADDPKFDQNGISNVPGSENSLAEHNQHVTALLLESGADQKEIEQANDSANSPIQTAGALIGLAATMELAGNLTAGLSAKLSQSMAEQGLAASTDAQPVAPAAETPDMLAANEPDQTFTQVDGPKAPGVM